MCPVDPTKPVSNKKLINKVNTVGSFCWLEFVWKKNDENFIKLPWFPWYQCLWKRSNCPMAPGSPIFILGTWPCDLHGPVEHRDIGMAPGGGRDAEKWSKCHGSWAFCLGKVEGLGMIGGFRELNPTHKWFGVPSLRCENVGRFFWEDAEGWGRWGVW